MKSPAIAVLLLVLLSVLAAPALAGPDFVLEVGLARKSAPHGSKIEIFVRFERPGPLRAADFRRLAKGEKLVRTLDLNHQVYGGLTPGRYRITVGYRNREPGLRFGFPGPAGTGTIWSAPVSLVVE